jgi:hypothetical protein
LLADIKIGRRAASSTLFQALRNDYAEITGSVYKSSQNPKILPARTSFSSVEFRRGHDQAPNHILTKEKKFFAEGTGYSFRWGRKEDAEVADQVETGLPVGR